jgi:hypothetical protein
VVAPPWKRRQWKRDHGARSILVLEDNDLFLTNEAIVTETYLRLAMPRVDQPSETYLVSTATTPWHA